MRVLLTGGTGVLSTDIANYALSIGMEVYLLNRGSKKQFFPPNAKIIIADIRNVKEVQEKIKDMYFDVVVDFLSYNVEQLKSTLSIFNFKCNQFIFISSATAYQDANIITENTPLGNSNWSYAQNKIECEKLLADNYNLYKQKYTIVRPYVTYGKTRIPFAIIPHDKHWSLANRILIGKPILLWDGGKATCTLTNTKDFAVGIVGLFGNEKAYQNDFHITTDHTLTWREALLDIGSALGKEPIIADIPSSFIFKEMPELKEVISGDKGRNMIFDNSKIKSVVSNFKANTTFKEGIRETIQFYKENDYMRKIDYKWDARIDNLISKYYKKNLPTYIDKNSLTNKVHSPSQTFKEKIIYTFCRYDFLYAIYNIINLFTRGFKKIMRIIKSKRNK